MQGRSKDKLKPKGAKKAQETLVELFFPLLIGVSADGCHYLLGAVDRSWCCGYWSVHGYKERLNKDKVVPNCFHRLGLDGFYCWYLNLACGFCNGAMRSCSAASAGTTLQFMLLIASVRLSFL